MESNLPRLLTPEQCAEYLGMSVESLSRWRSDNTGPAYIKISNGTIRYPEHALKAFIDASLQLPLNGGKAATPAAIQAAMAQGHAERRAALQERTRAMQQLDKDDRESLTSDSGVAGVTPLTVSGVGETPGSNFQKFNTVPAVPWEAPPPPHVIEGR